MIKASIDKVLKAADVIADIRRAFEKIQNLETGQRTLADTLDRLDDRVRTLEIELRAARAEIKDASREIAVNTVNGAQGQFMDRIVDLEIKVAKASDELSDLRTVRATPLLQE